MCGQQTAALKTVLMHITSASTSFLQAEGAREVQRMQMQQREEAAQAAEAAALADLSGQRQVQVQDICLPHFLKTLRKKCISFLATCHGRQVACRSVLEVYSPKQLLKRLLTG